MKLPPLFNFSGSPEFTTDGCSGYMTYLWGLFNKKPPWNHDCVHHDFSYWSAAHSRRVADAVLFRDIRGKGHPVWAWLIWLGVRLGGSQLFPFSWRWRYREPYLSVLKSIWRRDAPTKPTP